jgi:hypothetical protein
MSPKSATADTDLGFTRDRQSISPMSATADLGGGFPQKMRLLKEARARFRFNLIGTRSKSRKIARPKTFRIAMRLPLIASFSAVVLLAVSGAFLIGLALVGFFAAALAGFDLIRKHMPRPAVPPLCPLDRRAIG